MVFVSYELGEPLPTVHIKFVHSVIRRSSKEAVGMTVLATLPTQSMDDDSCASFWVDGI